MTLSTIDAPYLLLMGDRDDPMSAKTALGIAHWRPERCLAQLRLPGCHVDAGLPDMSPAQAAAAGARTLVVGVAPAGGRLPGSWEKVIGESLESGLDIASGLHERLSDMPTLAETAARAGRRILDVRHPTFPLTCGTGLKRQGKRLLTVGTDCCVGKMFAALSIEREMRARGIDADFRATGQTGILIAGTGIAVDAVVADFISGAAEALAPANRPDHWDVIEGQGSLFHPSYAGVSLGLLHGSQPDILVLCHAAGRTALDGHEPWPIPGLAECAEENLRLARLTNPKVRLGGVCLNTSSLCEDDAREAVESIGREMGVPCVDPVRHGAGPIVDGLA